MKMPRKDAWRGCRVEQAVSQRDTRAFSIMKGTERFDKDGKHNAKGKSRVTDAEPEGSPCGPFTLWCNRLPSIDCAMIATDEGKNFF